MTKAREKRWVVREGDGTTVGEILQRARERESAVDEGRVFLGRTRVKSTSESVKVGDELRIGPAARDAAVPAWSVIWEKEGLLAVNKPAGIPTVPDHAGASHALVALAAESRGMKVNELFVTSRLDREVSGVVVFAMTKTAEERLRIARAEGHYTRRYIAIAQLADQAGELGERGVWTVAIGPGKDARHRAALGPGTPAFADAKEARTRWAVVARADRFVMLAVEPATGRTHQIRVHASHAGAPLLGDRDYGGPTKMTLRTGGVVALTRIALHAARVTLPDGLVAAAPVPPELGRVWTELGGAAEAWDRALSCELEA